MPAGPVMKRGGTAPWLFGWRVGWAKRDCRSPNAVGWGGPPSSYAEDLMAFSLGFSAFLASDAAQECAASEGEAVWCLQTHGGGHLCYLARQNYTTLACLRCLRWATTGWIFPKKLRDHREHLSAAGGRWRSFDGAVQRAVSPMQTQSPAIVHIKSAIWRHWQISGWSMTCLTGQENMQIVRKSHLLPLPKLRGIYTSALCDVGTVSLSFNLGWLLFNCC